jgi:hypothetical protein
MSEEQDPNSFLNPSVQNIQNAKISVDFEYNAEALNKSLAFMKQLYAYIEIKIDDPFFVFKDTPDVIKPEPLQDDPHELELVYPIYDFGDRLTSSKTMDKEIDNHSMLKMFFTIEKMISIMYYKIKHKSTSGGEEKAENLFYLDGHILCLRKAFEVMINLPDNWVVMNFEPGQWGNNYLATLQRLKNKDFQYPPPAPRDNYRQKVGVNYKKTSLIL